MPRASYPGGEIGPLGVLLLDEPDLPCPLPFLGPLLTRDRGFHGLVRLGVDHTMDFVVLGETGNAAGTMSLDPAGEVRCHSDVERAVFPAREDIDTRASDHSQRLVDSRLRGNDGESAGMTGERREWRGEYGTDKERAGMTRKEQSPNL